MLVLTFKIVIVSPDCSAVNYEGIDSTTALSCTAPACSDF